MTTPINLSKYIPPSPFDTTWYDSYVAKMGEKEFWEYKNRLYNLLDRLIPGQSIDIPEWSKPENFDLFVKIAYCYVAESQCCYAFNKEFTTIKMIFDAREMEKTLALFRQKRREKENGANGSGAGSGSPGTAPVPTPEQEVQGKEG